ncbi:hypothetical protein GCM10007147_27470 [Nocardiopsis kunsanensis]|uniref:Uncharacterized protein n=1 Tax=Nocardiopsis kunsanensis TaxID=141693 RepID=A0A919CI76_9ACTN|nr:hypothetical protein [Nocardiopsis kunsanensis]GHD27952.1 hypothetical protein GCM10007147_27470 [Nocardiopsis kunsanensis]
MGDFFSSLLPPGLIDVLSALLPPVVVGGTFCFFIIKILRNEMAPRRSDGSLVGKGTDSGDESGRDAAESGDAATANEASNAGDGERADSDGR